MVGINKGINAIYKWMLSVFGIVILGVIFAISFICTCYRASDSNEVTFFCQDNIFKNLIFILLFFSVIIVFEKTGLWRKYKDKIENDSIFCKAKKILLLVVFIVSACWVLMTQYVPGSDQMDVVQCAYKLYAGETNMLEPGGYLDKWTNQAGIVVIDYFLARIWGDFNITAFQILNAVGLTLIYKKMTDIMDDFGASKSSQFLTLLSALGFVPMIMYTSFVYGTIWHVTLSLMAFSQEYRFIKDGKWWRIILSAISIALAIQVKNNALIFLVAMVIYLLINMLTDRESVLKKAVFLICTSLVVILFAKFPGYFIEQKTGYSLDQGVSSWAFVAMGLQESEYPPGWWNGYNNQTYAESGYNTEIEAQMAKEEIASLLDEYATNKKHAISFFSGKIASMWAEPTYQCIWINQIRNHRVILPKWIENLMTAEGYTKIANKMDYMQLLLYLIPILWLLLVKGEDFNKKSFFLLVFVGGFLFHIAWEAKTQYSVTYSMLLLPYCAMGVDCIFDKAENAEYKINNPLLVVFIISIIGFIIAYRYSSTDCLTSDGDIYTVYLSTWEEPYTNESVLDINTMKVYNEDYQNMIIYLEHVLEENGIGY